MIEVSITNLPILSTKRKLNTMIANKLNPGDQIRIIAPSDSLSTLKPEVYQKACRILSEEFEVTFSRHCRECNKENSSKIKERVEDLHEAFEDTKVKAIIAATGGYNVNQILPYINESIIARNPKILCGFSDITALLNAIYAKIGLVTYYGADFATLGSSPDIEYTMNYVRKCLMNESPYEIKPSSSAKVYQSIQEGEAEAEGIIIGGNICTLNLLQGTEYMPDLNDKILFLEDQAGECFRYEFDRDLESLLQIKELTRLKGLVLGRFPKECHMTEENVKRMVSTKTKLKGIPIALNVDFGHVGVLTTFPIGGRAKIVIKKEGVCTTIVEH